MPTRVQDRPKNEIPGHAPDALHEHDLANVNKNLQHKALRLALGSILTPKRPYSPPSRSHSRSSSGTASPTLSFSFPSVSPSPPLIVNQPPPPHSTPIHGHSHGWLAESHMQPLHMLPHSHHSHPHTPSRLGITDLHSNDYLSPHSQSPTAPGSPTSSSSHNSPVIPPNASMPHPPETFLRLPDAASGRPSKADAIPAIQAPAPMQPTEPDPHSATKSDAHYEESDDKASGTSNGLGMPKAKFIETLQSKSAWDALIHGSFS